MIIDEWLNWQILASLPDFNILDFLNASLEFITINYYMAYKKCLPILTVFGRNFLIVFNFGSVLHAQPSQVL